MYKGIRYTTFFLMSISVAILYSNPSVRKKSSPSKPNTSAAKNPFQWPVPKKVSRRRNSKIYAKQNKQISSTFGESRTDHFHTGVDIPGEDLPVYPLQNGELLWVKSSYRRLNETEFGAGNTVVIKHTKLWSGYMHLKRIEDRLFKQNYLLQKDKIGLSGSSGHSGGAHLHFFLFEPQELRMYNPLLFFSKGFIEDRKSPVFKSLYQKEGKMFLPILDRGKANERWGIFYLKTFGRNNRLLQDLAFDFIELTEGVWKTSNKQPFASVYDRANYYIPKEAVYWEAGGYSGPNAKSRLE